jgi:hypothetical protein
MGASAESDSGSRLGGELSNRRDGSGSFANSSAAGAGRSDRTGACCARDSAAQIPLCRRRSFRQAGCEPAHHLSEIDGLELHDIPHFIVGCAVDDLPLTALVAYGEPG